MQEVITLTDIETAQDLLRYIKEEKPDYTLNSVEDSLEYEDTDYKVTIPQEYAHLFKSEDYSDKLIFGKDPLEGIVSIEVKDNKVYLFLNNGDVQSKPMIYWMLADKKLDKNFEKLEGNQHYKWIRRFTSVSTFKKFAIIYKKMNKDTFQIWNEKEAAMIYYGYTMFKGLKVEDVSVLSFDIEAAGLTHDEDSEVYLITNTFRKNGKITKVHFRVDHYDDDIEMIKDWCKWVVQIDPTVITGHNIFSFDFPYLQYCYGKHLPLGKYADPMEVAKRDSQLRVDGNQSWSYKKLHIFGRHIVDGMFLAVKYDVNRKYPSWGLKQIAEFEGFITEDRQFYDASKIRDNWSDPIEREKIVQYGIDDSDDSIKVYDLMIPGIFYMTQSVPKPFQLSALSGTGASLNAILLRSYLQDGHSIPKASERETVSGGISFGVPGVHKNVLKIDIKSMYPSIIRSKSLYSKTKDPKQYFLKMVNYFTDERFKNKRLYKETGDKYYNDLQASQKIGINSAYGLCGTSGLNFNDFSIANEITKTARQLIKDTIYWATGKPIKSWFPEYDESKDLI